MNEPDQKPSVVVIRQKSGPDIVGIVVGGKTKEEGLSTFISSYMVEHPYVPIMDYSSGSFSLIPFCPLTDQTVFEFHAKDMVFMVPAKEELTMNYLKGLDVRTILSVTDSDELKRQKIEFRNAIETLTLAPGTETIQ